MNGFAEEDRIYFASKNKVSYAGLSSLYRNKIISGIIDSDDFENIQSRRQTFSNKLKRMHSAEHKLFNLYFSRLKKNKGQDLNRQELLALLPSSFDLKNVDSFSLFCATTQAYFLILYSLLILFLQIFLNLFVVIPLALSLSVVGIYFIQKKYFLAEPEEIELEIAIEALKKLIKESEDVSDS